MTRTPAHVPGGVTSRRTHEPFGHTAPWTLWACPFCGGAFREGSTPPGGCCGRCADGGLHVMPVRAEGPRRRFPEEQEG